MSDITAAPYTYTATTKTGSGFLASGKLMDGFTGVVVRSDGVEVWRSGKLYGGARGKSAAQLRANRAVGAFRQHYAREGVCWHDQRLAKRATHRAWLKQREALEGALLGAVRAAVRERLNHHPDGTRKADAGPPPAEFETPAQWAIYRAAFEAAAALPPEPEKA